MIHVYNTNGANIGADWFRAVTAAILELQGAAILSVSGPGISKSGNCLVGQPQPLTGFLAVIIATTPEYTDNRYTIASPGCGNTDYDDTTAVAVGARASTDPLYWEATVTNFGEYNDQHTMNIGDVIVCWMIKDANNGERYVTYSSPGFHSPTARYQVFTTINDPAPHEWVWDFARYT